MNKKRSSKEDDDDDDDKLKVSLPPPQRYSNKQRKELVQEQTKDKDKKSFASLVEELSPSSQHNDHDKEEQKRIRQARCSQRGRERARRQTDKLEKNRPKKRLTTPLEKCKRFFPAKDDDNKSFASLEAKTFPSTTDTQVLIDLDEVARLNHQTGPNDGEEEKEEVPRRDDVVPQYSIPPPLLPLRNNLENNDHPQPGAYPVRGMGYPAAGSTSSLTVDESRLHVTSTTTTSTTTTPASGENNDRETLFMADVVNTVEAEEVDVEAQLKTKVDKAREQWEEQAATADKTRLNQRRQRQRVMIAVVVTVLVVVVVVIVLVTRQTSHNSTLLPTSSPIQTNQTLMPTSSPLCAGFPCNTTNMSTMEVLQEASNHTLLAEYLNRDYNLDLQAYLNSNNLTLLAPTDESFRALEPPYSYYLNKNIPSWGGHLWLMLLYHFLSSPETARQIFQSSELPTINPYITLAVNTSNRTIDEGIAITTADIQTSNGYIQVLDGVVVVDVLQESLLYKVVGEGFVFSKYITKFRKLLQTAGLEDLLLQNLENGLSVFVPEDAAFHKLDKHTKALLFETANETFIRNFVLYHIFNLNIFEIEPGEEHSFLMFNNVSVWLTNYDDSNITSVNTAKTLETYIGSNGFFHIIDQVLIPPNIGELIKITNDVSLKFNFTTFLSLVDDHAHLGNLLKGSVNGQMYLDNYFTGTEYLTVFVPNESAFAQVDPKLLTRLSDPSWLLHLQSWCLHHFTLETTFHDSTGPFSLPMLSGFETTLDVVEVGLTNVQTNKTINGVRVEFIPWYSFLGASNGMIRSIAGVLMPPWVDQPVYDQLIKEPELSIFSSLVQQSSWKALLNNTDSGPYTLLAPNNAAFGQFGNQTSSTANNDAAFYDEIVSHYILLGNMYTLVLDELIEVVSLANETLAIQTIFNNTYVGGALVVHSNILASNGMIHVLDIVL